MICTPFFLAGLRWGLPSAYQVAPDALPPLRSLRTATNWPLRGPGPDKYPEGYHLLVGSLQRLGAPFLLSEEDRERLDQIATGMQRRSEAGEEVVYGREVLQEGATLQGPLSRLTLLGRSLTIVMALALVALVYLAAEKLSGLLEAFLAALLFGLSPAVIHYAATLNVDIPYLCWLAASLVLAQRTARRPTRASAAALGVALALSAATKDQAIGAFPGIALLLLAWSPGRASPRERLRRLPCGALVIAFVAAYALTSGLLHPADYARHLRFLFGEGSRSYREFPLTLTGLLGYASHLSTLLVRAGGLLPALLGGAALVFALLRPRRRVMLVLAVGASYVLLFLAPIGYAYPRFLLPVLVAICVASAGLFRAAVHLVPARARCAVRGLLVVAVLGMQLPGAVSFAAYKLADPRPRAMAELAGLRRPGERVLVSPAPYFAVPYPLPPPPIEVEGFSLVGAEERMQSADPPEWWVVSLFESGGGTTLGRVQVGQRFGRFEVVRVYGPDGGSPLGQSLEIQPLVLLLRAADG